MASVTNIFAFADQNQSTRLPNLVEQPVHERRVVAWNRPDDVYDYAADDVVSDDNGDAKVLEFEGCAKQNGGSGQVMGATLQAEFGVGNTLDFSLFIFDLEPTNFADNQALALTDSDADKVVAGFNFDGLSGVSVNTNRTMYFSSGLLLPAPSVSFLTGGAEPLPTARHYACGSGSRSLFGLLTTRSVFTPVALRRFTVSLHVAMD